MKSRFVLILFSALEEDKALLEEELTKYRDDVRMLEEALSVLEAQATDYKQEILSLKRKEDRLVENVRTEKEKFAKEINALKQEISGLRVERRRFQRDISVSRADKSNTERAYNALKTQRDSLQTDVTSLRQEEKRYMREIANMKSEKSKLEREVQNLKSENIRLKGELVHADKIKTDIRILQKNEEKIASLFNLEKDKLFDELSSFKDKFTRLENDFNKIITEKDKLSKQLKRYSQTVSDTRDSTSAIRRTQSQPQSVQKGNSPDSTKAKRKNVVSEPGALVRRSIHEGQVSEMEGKVLDLQRRLAFFMAEKEDIQKELITSRERNDKLTTELHALEVSVILALLSKKIPGFHLTM